MPLLPASLIEPLWAQFSTLLKDNDRPEFVADHPWGCHRRRIPDRVVFDHVLAALVHGSGYERIATPGCSDRTIRRRLAEWAERNVGVELLKAALAAYDRLVVLERQGMYLYAHFGLDLAAADQVELPVPSEITALVRDGKKVAAIRDYRREQRQPRRRNTRRRATRGLSVPTEHARSVSEDDPRGAPLTPTSGLESCP